MSRNTEMIWHDRRQYLWILYFCYLFPSWWVNILFHRSYDMRMYNKIQYMWSFNASTMLRNFSRTLLWQLKQVWVRPLFEVTCKRTTVSLFIFCNFEMFLILVVRPFINFLQLNSNCYICHMWLQSFIADHPRSIDYSEWGTYFREGPDAVGY